MTVVTIIQTTEIENNFDDKCPSCRRNRIAKRSAIKDSSFFFIPNFWSSSDESKPDFITTFDLFRLLNQDYALKQFYCVTNQEPCDSVGLRLKASIPEAINTDCRRCTLTEMNNIRRIMNFVKNNYPEFWRRIEPIYKKKKIILKISYG